MNNYYSSNLGFYFNYSVLTNDSGGEVGQL